MALRIVGAGFGRTGTLSLKLAIEQLLGAPCHHMVEVLGKPEQMELWAAAVDGRPDWDRIFNGYAATVDWPSVAFWEEIANEYPDAVVLLSQRADADAWWRSAHGTIFQVFNRPSPADPDMAGVLAWMDAVRRIVSRNGVDPADEAASKAAYPRHLDDVRRAVPAERLVEWHTGDGWAPLCRAIGVPEPADPFPHVNTTEETRACSGSTPERPAATPPAAIGRRTID